MLYQGDAETRLRVLGLKPQPPIPAHFQNGNGPLQFQEPTPFSPKRNTNTHSFRAMIKNPTSPFYPSVVKVTCMSAREIIEELPRLTPAELLEVENRLRELQRRTAAAAPGAPVRWGEALLEIAGTAEGLPPDFAENHDHYLHGAP